MNRWECIMKDRKNPNCAVRFLSLNLEKIEISTVFGRIGSARRGNIQFTWESLIPRGKAAFLNWRKNKNNFVTKVKRGRGGGIQKAVIPDIDDRIYHQVKINQGKLKTRHTEYTILITEKKQKIRGYRQTILLRTLRIAYNNANKNIWKLFYNRPV